MQTAIVYSDELTRHVTPYGHPERPERVRVIAEILQKSVLDLLWLLPRKATVEEILLCHSSAYLSAVENEVSALKPKELRMLSTGDVTICPASYEVALLAVGSVLTAVDAVMQKKAKNSFCVVRPPGHHATSDRGMGFCLFNNVAIGARYVQKKYGVSRVLIIDWDLHHGNGTQAIFYNDPSVYYFSTHQRGIYPGTGRASEIGVGNIFNFEISPGAKSGDEIFALMQTTLETIFEQVKPEFVFISAGFDAHKDDPLGALGLTSDHFFELTQLIKGYAKKWAHNRLVSVLEGGYNLQAISESSLRHVEALSVNE